MKYQSFTAFSPEIVSIHWDTHKHFHVVYIITRIDGKLNRFEYYAANNKTEKTRQIMKEFKPGKIFEFFVFKITQTKSFHTKLKLLDWV